MSEQTKAALNASVLVIPILWVGAMVAFSGQTSPVILLLISALAAILSAVRREWVTVIFIGSTAVVIAVFLTIAGVF